MSELHFCERCNRRLKSAKAIEDGMGKVCKQKSIAEKDKTDKEQDQKQSA